MERAYFMKTDRVGFSRWNAEDGKLAELLWGDPAVTKYICVAGRFTPEEVTARLNREIDNDAAYHVQYWPVFELKSGELIGCCGLRPYKDGRYEIGVHLRPRYWGRGYGSEAARAVIRYAFSVLRTEGLFAGHNPRNTASADLLRRLGFRYVGDEFYEPTGLYHPSYELNRDDIEAYSGKPE